MQLAEEVGSAEDVACLTVGELWGALLLPLHVSGRGVGDTGVGDTGVGGTGVGDIGKWWPKGRHCDINLVSLEETPECSQYSGAVLFPVPSTVGSYSSYLRPPVVVLYLEGHPDVVQEQRVLLCILKEGQPAVTRAQVICASHEEDLASS